ncbi:MAG: hypothetical protein ACI9Y7_001942 [Dokdonia sp.]|jgi:hypothetical protein
MLGVGCWVLGVGCLVFGVWCLVFGVWCLVFGVCKGLKIVTYATNTKMNEF